MIEGDVVDLLPGEQILWQGRPSQRAILRDVMHIRGITLYLALAVVWQIAGDTSQRLGLARALTMVAPQLVMSVSVILACTLFAWGCARTTMYRITTYRCLLSFGIALTGTLSLPLQQIASISFASRRDDSGDIVMLLKGGRSLSLLKIWPHARAWRIKKPQPMLRGVERAAHVADTLARAAANVAAVRSTAALITSQASLESGSRVLSGAAAAR